MGEHMTPTAVGDGPQQHDLSEPALEDANRRAARDEHNDLIRCVESHIAQLIRVLDADGHPITSRAEAARLELLPEWEHVGHLCVCREVLPPMPRWLPQSQATQLLADAEARCHGSSILHLIGVEFADGFITALERDELRILPLEQSISNPVPSFTASQDA